MRNITNRISCSQDIYTSCLVLVLGMRMPCLTLSGVLTSALSWINSLTASRCGPRRAFMRGVSPSCGQGGRKYPWRTGQHAPGPGRPTPHPSNRKAEVALRRCQGPLKITLCSCSVQISPSVLQPDLNLESPSSNRDA